MEKTLCGSAWNYSLSRFAPETGIASDSNSFRRKAFSKVASCPFIFPVRTQLLKHVDQIVGGFLRRFKTVETVEPTQAIGANVRGHSAFAVVVPLDPNADFHCRDLPL
jgi:hypothetical protein